MRRKATRRRRRRRRLRVMNRFGIPIEPVPSEQRYLTNRATCAGRKTTRERTGFCLPGHCQKNGAATGGAFSATPAALKSQPATPLWTLLPEEFSIRCDRGKLEFDLGAIGKGFALDRMAEVLREWDCPAFLLVAGGSSILAGDPPADNTGWSCGLGDDNSPQRYWLTNCSLSGSGLAVKGQHIFDPRTGQPAQRRKSRLGFDRHRGRIRRAFNGGHGPDQKRNQRGSGAGQILARVFARDGIVALPRQPSSSGAGLRLERDYVWRRNRARSRWPARHQRRCYPSYIRIRWRYCLRNVCRFNSREMPATSETPVPAGMSCASGANSFMSWRWTLMMWPSQNFQAVNRVSTRTATQWPVSAQAPMRGSRSLTTLKT